jgi:hypothetical protein
MREILIPLASAFATAVGGTLVAWFLARVRSDHLARTLDQASKIIGFVGQYAAGYEGLAKIPEEKRTEVETLIRDVMQAVREDFAAERAVLPQFAENTSSIRRVLLLDFPRRRIAWLPFLLFHTFLLFVLYVFFVRVLQGRWEIGDTVAILVSLACAALSRLAVRLLSRP